MSLRIDYSFISKVVPGANKILLKGFVDTFNQNADKYEINTPQRLAAFLSQVAHESDGLKTASEYASGSAYEGRKDLGNSQKGDGVKFKGRGVIQTTGRNNYADTSKALFNDPNVLLNNPTKLEEPQTATLSAMYFWKSKGLNIIADKPDDWTIVIKTKKGPKTLNKFEYITYRINGGFNGLAARKSYWNKFKSMINTAVKDIPKINFGLLIVGLTYAAYLYHS
jgi:putative chitinase